MVGWGVVVAVIYLAARSDFPSTPWFKRGPTTAPDLEFERTHPRPPLRPRITPVCALVPVPPALAAAPSTVPPSVVRAPQPAPVSAPAVQTPIAAKPQRAKAPVVTVSTQVRLRALAALRRLGFTQKDAQAQLDTTLGFAIQQSLLRFNSHS
jgi:hypothetical protein